LIHFYKRIIFSMTEPERGLHLGYAMLEKEKQAKY